MVALASFKSLPLGPIEATNGSSFVEVISLAEAIGGNGRPGCCTVAALAPSLLAVGAETIPSLVATAAAERVGFAGEVVAVAAGAAAVLTS